MSAIYEPLMRSLEIEYKAAAKFAHIRLSGQLMRAVVFPRVCRTSYVHTFALRTRTPNPYVGYIYVHHDRLRAIPTGRRAISHSAARLAPLDNDNYHSPPKSASIGPRSDAIRRDL